MAKEKLIVEDVLEEQGVVSSVENSDESTGMQRFRIASIRPNQPRVVKVVDKSTGVEEERTIESCRLVIAPEDKLRFKKFCDDNGLDPEKNYDYATLNRKSPLFFKSFLCYVHKTENGDKFIQASPRDLDALTNAQQVYMRDYGFSAGEAFAQAKQDLGF